MQNYSTDIFNVVSLSSVKSDFYQFLKSKFVHNMSIKGIFPIDKWDFQSESILADLPLEDFELLTANKTEKIYKKGEVIFW